MQVVIHVRVLILSQRFGSQIAAGEYEILKQEAKTLKNTAIASVQDPPATGGRVREI